MGLESFKYYVVIKHSWLRNNWMSPFEKGFLHFRYFSAMLLQTDKKIYIYKSQLIILTDYNKTD